MRLALHVGGAHHPRRQFVQWHAYDRSCAAWREALSIYTGLERRGALTGTDRDHGMRNVRNFVHRACEGGPPQPRLGSSIQKPATREKT